MLRRWEKTALACVQARKNVQAGIRPVPGQKDTWDVKQALLAFGWAQVTAPGPDPAALIVLRQLLRAGADLEEMARDGSAALHLACRWRDLEAVQLLLAAGADPNVRMGGRPDGPTALIVACDFEDVPWPGSSDRPGHLGWAAPVVKLLIDAGADVNAVVRSGGACGVAMGCVAHACSCMHLLPNGCLQLAHT